MLPTLIVSLVVAGSGLYFYFYQIWPTRSAHGRALRIHADRWFPLAYRYIQVSTPIYAGLSVVNYHLPWRPEVAWIGLGLSTASTLLFVWSMLSLREQYSHCFDSYVPDELVERGPYRFIRHPIYTANCLALLGLFLATASAGVMLNCAILAFFYYRAASWEEATLAQHLPGYAGYLLRTGRFLPSARRLVGSLLPRAKSKACAALVASAFLCATQGGCVVPQPPGKGTVSHQTEKTSHADYWLYLPADYGKASASRSEGPRWPVVMTFHGTKPFDNSNSQIREWQQEADRYGFIVIAPDLRTCDVFMQFPLRDPSLPYIRHDEKATLAIMDKVFSETAADPARVLCTGWSTGGYMAHFMANRHPERFSCLAVRESPFSESLLDPDQVPKYRNMKVAIFFGENDFPVCRTGSNAAIEWYRSHGFSVESQYVVGAGHERIPQTVADFYASTIGLTPKTPSTGQSLMREVVSRADR